MKVIKATLKYYKKFLPYFILALFLGVLFQICGLMLPKIIGLIVDYGLNFNNTIIPSNNSNPFIFLTQGNFGAFGSVQLLISLCVTFAILLLIKHTSQYSRNYFGQYHGMYFNKELRFAALQKLYRKNSFDSAGVVYTNLNNDTVNIKEFYVTYIPYLIDNSFIFVLAFVLIASINLWLALMPLIFAPIIVFFSFKYLKAGNRVTNRSRTCFVDLTYAVQENLSNINLVKQYGMEEFENSIFRGYNRRHAQANIKQNRIQTKFNYIFNILRALTYVSTVTVGAILAVQKTISIGNLLEVITYVYMILDAITNFMTYLFNCMQMSASGNRYVNFMNSSEKVNDNGVKIIGEKPNISIKEFCLNIVNQNLLTDINLEIPYGKKIGLTGGMGSGKTVLLKSVNRFLEGTHGGIYFNDVEIKDIKLSSLHNTIGQVFQENIIFSTTIRKNINFGNKDITDDEMINMIEFLGGKEDFDTYPNGLDTAIEEKGHNLTNHMIKIITLCRGFVYNADIILLDAPLSDIDNERKKQVLKSIYKLCENKTLLIATNNPVQLKACDEILYFENGRILERGTHKELMALKGKYSSICKEKGGQIDE